MLTVHLCVHVFDFLDKFATVVCIIYNHVVFLGFLFFLKCFNETVTTVFVDMAM